MAARDAGEHVEATRPAPPIPVRQCAPELASGIVEAVLGVQRSAGNRAARAWARRLSRKPAPKPVDPYDAAV